VAGGVKDEVPVARPVGDVVAGVVDDLVGAERPDEVELAGAADPGDAGAERLGQLDRERPDAAGGPDDQDPLPAWISPTSRRPWRAARPEMGTAAACSKPRLAGMGTSWSSGTEAYSA
jgi:hypothetical protein